MATKKKAQPVTRESILALRRGLGLNQQQFWSQLGVTQSGGSRYESGRNIPLPTRKLIYLVHFAPNRLDPAQIADMATVKNHPPTTQGEPQ